MPVRLHGNRTNRSTRSNVLAGMTGHTKRIGTAAAVLAVAALASLGLCRSDPAPASSADAATGDAKWSDIELKR